MARGPLIGIDVGGTFTDAVVFAGDDGRVLDAFKLPSTPADPAEAVLAALRRIAQRLPLQGATVCHGTTVGTNALLERRGARVALLATRGFTDLIELRRQDRPTLYDLAVKVSEPLVPAQSRIGVDERLDAAGAVVEALGGLPALLERLQAMRPQAIAVSLLHAYANPAHETALQRVLQEAFPQAFICLSSDVCPEFREYERTSTTVVNAYIGPAVGRYIDRLHGQAAELGVQDVLIVKSNGGLTSPANAARYPVHLIESGPAAGMIATAAFARATGRPDVIAFDMGGTTAKAGVITGFEAQVTNEFKADALHDGRLVGGYPIRSAVLDLVEIGAGGGSLAWIDAGGVLKVGPRSAGADPGPACYCRGGTLPTVTDAHAVIGTLSGRDFEQAGVRFSRDRAVQAVQEHIAGPMGWSLARAAHGILAIAVASMTEMVRLATVNKGLDPRGFTLLAAGGAGPLHAALVGREVGVKEIVVPPYPGMFSAIGATLGDIRHDLSQTLLQPVAALQPEALLAGFAGLRSRAGALLAQEVTSGGTPRLARFAELRYAGQLFELRVPLGGVDDPLPTTADIESAFRQAYAREFGFELPRAAVQLVKLVLVATRELGSPARGLFNAGGGEDHQPQPHGSRECLAEDGATTRVPVYRSADCAGLRAAGPLLVEHAGATVWVPQGLQARVGADGSIAMEVPA
ncbi:MAG TPA: hydantoinase/oxoprolinase family protein [Ramlibacter sp.]|nr:hydantoinase/oxoprolinase family protein [Ramlibacter sp.]